MWGCDVREVRGVVLVPAWWGGVIWVGLGWVVGEGNVVGVTDVMVVGSVHGSWV